MHPIHSMSISAWRPARVRIPLKAEWEERAIYTLEGDVRSRATVSRRPAAGVPPRRRDRRCRRKQGAHFMLFGGASLASQALYLVELRVVVEGADRTGQGGMAIGPVRHRARRRGRVHPAAGELNAKAAGQGNDRMAAKAARSGSVRSHFKCHFTVTSTWVYTQRTD